VTGADRLFWVTLRRLWARWSDVLVFVKPETVIQWHRAGFRRYWTCLSRRQRTGRPSINSGLRELILRLLAENPTWGAPRIHDELLMLGLSISERTVSRYLPRQRPHSGALERWMQFLRNHRDAIAAMDFFTVPTTSFRILYVWFAIDHAKRRVLHFDVTDRPAAAWVVQQLREAFPHDSTMRHLIFDRDAIFSDRVLTTVNALGLRPGGRPSEALGRTVSQSVGSEACVANCSITPSSSTSVTFADCWESTLPTTIRTARTTRLKRRLPAVVFPLPRREPALLSWLAGGWAVCSTGTTGLHRRMGG